MNFKLPPDPRVGTVLAGRYRIDSVIGEGAMGKVYAAEHVLMRKRLAVKVLHRELSSVPELVQRFEREAMAAANIDHPNVASATDFGKLDDGSVFLALELVEGRCLRDEIAKGPMASLRALHVARQIAAAIGSAHALSIVHRDLKPENVMLVEKGGDPDFVKVLDFGVARVPIGDAAPGAGGPITRAGMVFGTPEYIPPEQALGQVSDGRADLYSLGVILFEMLAGSRPFVADSKVSLVGQHLGKPPPRLVERGVTVAEPVEGLVLRLLEKEAARRPQEAEEVVKAIDVLVGKPQRGQSRRGRTPERRGAKAFLARSVKDLRSLTRPAFRTLITFVDRQRGLLPPVWARRLAGVSSSTLGLIVIGASALLLVLALFGIGSLLSRGEPKIAARSAPSTGLPGPSSAGAPPAPARPAASTPAPPASASAAELRADALLDEARSRALAKDYPAAVADVKACLALAPDRKQDGRAATVLFQAAQAKPAFEAAFALLEGPMEERGAAIVHDLAVFAPKGGVAQLRAERFLDSPRFQAIAAPPLRLAASLRRSRRCADVRSLLVEVRKIGDKHSLPYLRFFAEHLGSYPCLKGDALLAETTKAVELRSKTAATD
ncbi:MAG TPA: serine/threonine-protein kinase [Polyangiaceae bacterium]